MPYNPRTTFTRAAFGEARSFFSYIPRIKVFSGWGLGRRQKIP